MSEGPAQILAADTPELFEEALRRAAELLRAGQVVALPTETVYGLAANAFNPAAVERIFQAKGRPSFNPIIVHVASGDMARRCAATWPETAQKLAEAFWPGPLTLVVERAAAVPDIVTAGGPTVGLRWPNHPFIQAVLRRCGFPLAAPSANLSNQLSPTTAEHVRAQLGNAIPLIVDGGSSQVGIESTVIDVTCCPPRVLRPGMIHDEALVSVIGHLAGGEAGGVLRSPGLLKQHYAPRARLQVASWADERELLQLVRASGVPPGRIAVLSHRVVAAVDNIGRLCIVPHDAQAFGRALYAELHKCDEAGAQLILVERVPRTSEWKAIADRLNRAAGAEHRPPDT